MDAACGSPVKQIFLITDVLLKSHIACCMSGKNITLWIHVAILEPAPESKVVEIFFKDMLLCAATSKGKTCRNGVITPNGKLTLPDGVTNAIYKYLTPFSAHFVQCQMRKLQFWFVLCFCYFLRIEKKVITFLSIEFSLIHFFSFGDQPKIIHPSAIWICSRLKIKV